MPIDIMEPLEKADEPVKEPAENEGRADEEVKDEGRAEASPDPDEAADAPEGMEKAEWQALEKKQRDAFLKMSSSKSSRIQELEAERNRYAEELEKRQKIIDEVALKSGTETPKQKPLPEFQDMGQLVDYVKQEIRQESQREIDQRIQTYEQKKSYEERWVSGWNTVTEKDKTAHLFRDLVRNELMNSQSQYLKGYNGRNEAEILQKTVDGIRNIFQEHTNAEKQRVIQDMKRKTTATTEKATKSISVGKSPKEMSKSEIIAEMNAELGSNSDS